MTDETTPLPDATAADILAPKDLALEAVPVPEWSRTVYIAELTAAGRDAYEADIVDFRGGKRVLHMENVRAKLLVRTIVDRSRQRLFTDAQVLELGRQSSVVLARLFEVAQRLSGLSDNAVKETEKNSAPGPTDASASA